MHAKRTTTPDCTMSAQPLHSLRTLWPCSQLTTFSASRSRTSVPAILHGVHRCAGAPQIDENCRTSCCANFVRGPLGAAPNRRMTSQSVLKPHLTLFRNLVDITDLPELSQLSHSRARDSSLRSMARSRVRHPMPAVQVHAPADRYSWSTRDLLAEC